MTIFGIISLLLIFAGSYIFLYKNTNKDIFDSIFFTIIITIVLFFIFGALGGMNNKFEKDTKFGVTYINSLSINSNISGNFCLGSGTIQEINYYYYVSNSKFGYQISKIESNDNTYIKEDCKTKPYIEYTKYKCVHQNWFSKLMFKKELFNKDGEIIIHVPQNTVVKNYNVDISKL